MSLYCCYFTCKLICLIYCTVITQSPALSPIIHHFTIFTITACIASSLTRSVFHSELKTWLFSKSFLRYTFSFPTGLTTRTLGPSNNFTLLNGCTGKCVRLSRLLVGFRMHFKSLHFHSFIDAIPSGRVWPCRQTPKFLEAQLHALPSYS